MASPEATEIVLPPTPAAQLAASTIAAPPGEIRLLKITGQYNIAGFRWSEDGRAVVYATWEKDVGVKDWWEYDITTGEHRSVQPPFNLDQELWNRLDASFVDPFFIWFGGGISPSGTRVVYNRLPPGHNYTPAPNEFYLPPYEIWAARTDGNDAVKLQSCHRVGQAIWLDQETKVIFSCGYEGPDDIGMANVDGSSFVSLTGAFGGLCVGFYPMALSPDETKLAFTDSVFTLRIAPLDGSEIRPVAQWGYAPNWSPDGHRLYYQQGQELFSDVDICVYDLDTGVSTKLLSSPLRTSDGATVDIPAGKFVVSPLENAAVFQSQGLWLVTWSP